MSSEAELEVQRLSSDPTAAASLSEAAYKALKEGIVTGHTGTTATELVLLSINMAVRHVRPIPRPNAPAHPLCACCLCCVLLQTAFVLRSVLRSCVAPLTPPNGFVRIAIDFLCLCAVPLLGFALPDPSHTTLFQAVLLGAILAIALVNPRSATGPILVNPLSNPPDCKRPGAEWPGDDRARALRSPFKLYITEYRTSTCAEARCSAFTFRCSGA
jgi:hypothetical protein